MKRAGCLQPIIISNAISNHHDSSDVHSFHYDSLPARHQENGEAIAEACSEPTVCGGTRQQFPPLTKTFTLASSLFISSPPHSDAHPRRRRLLLRAPSPPHCMERPQQRSGAPLFYFIYLLVESPAALRAHHPPPEPEITRHHRL